MFKIEMKRAFCGKGFLFSLLVGFGICIGQFIYCSCGSLNTLALGPQRGGLPHSVFNRWIGGEMISFFPALFFALLPILAVLPHADTFYRDCDGGLVKGLYTRTKRKNYLISKYAAIFLSAGSAVAVPLLANLLLTMTVMPSIIPIRPTLEFVNSDPQGFLTELFYNNPYGYAVAYIALDFLIAGVLASVSLPVSFFSNNRFVPLIFPFALYLFAGTICTMTGFGGFSMMSFANPAQPNIGTRGSYVVLELLVLAIPSAFIFFYKGSRDDVF